MKKHLSSQIKEWCKDTLISLGNVLPEEYHKMSHQYVSSKIEPRWCIHYGSLCLQLQVPSYIIPFQNLDLGRNKDLSIIPEVEKIILEYFPKIIFPYCNICESRMLLNPLGKEKYICDNCLPEGDSKEIEFVYIFGNEVFYFYKIGRSNNPPGRMLDYARSKLPFELDLFHTIPTDNGPLLEKHFHSKFSSYRTNGEWFYIKDDKIIKEFKSIKSYYNGEFTTNGSNRL